MANDADTLKEGKEVFELCREREESNRRDSLDDLRFARLSEQWPETVKQERLKDGRPCLTINRLPAFIRQVVNDARQNKPSIKVHPADSVADPLTAKIYDGLIRNIEVTSRASIAYDTALDFSVTMGFGYWRINTEYACDDSFDLDLIIKRVANPFSIWGDPYSVEADSSDWNTCFVTDMISKDEFRKRYKGAEEVDWQAMGYETLPDPWREDERILIAEWFSREKVKKPILLLSDQSVMDAAEYEKHKDELDAGGITVVSKRTAPSYKVTQRVMTGAEVLEENPWAGKYIPIVPVYGEEVNVEGRRYFRGLVRDAKDPQRQFNFWRTAATELVSNAPRAPFIGPKGAFKSDAAKWSEANRRNHAYIEYDGQIPPQRQPFAGVPAGALQEAMSATDDLKSVMGLFDASLGARSNETSGRAILARQREGDVSTFHFIDNLSRSIEHTGRILIDMIPQVYNGQRIIRVLGDQGEVGTVPLNSPVQMQPPNGGLPLTHVYDLARGKYDLTVESGPSFTTRREEAAQQMLDLIQAFPQSAAVLGDMLAKNLDWPDADKIAERLHMLLPPQLQGGGAPGQAPAPNGPQPPQQNGEAEKMMTQINSLTLALKAAQADKSLEGQKVQIDAFNAKTDRMKALGDIAHKNRQILTEDALQAQGAF